MMQDKLANTTDMNSLVSMLSRREYSLAVGKKFSVVIWVLHVERRLIRVKEKNGAWMR